MFRHDHGKAAAIAALAAAIVGWLVLPRGVAAQSATEAAIPIAAESGLLPSFKDCAVCPEMVVLPAGSFMMGSTAGEEGRVDDREGPRREVTIARSFAVGKFEVTFAEWDACVAEGGCKHRPDDRGWGRGRQPVINVSWDDATTEYLPWLSRKTGKAYRLLTEAEWEYAARGKTSTRYWWGDQASREAIEELRTRSRRWLDSAQIKRLSAVAARLDGIALDCSPAAGDPGQA